MGAACQVRGRGDNENSQKLTLKGLPRLRPHESITRFIPADWVKT
jgi:hypothetical protein